MIDEGRKRVQSQVAAAAESGEEVKCCRQRNVEIVVFCGFSPDSILNFEGNKDMMNDLFVRCAVHRSLQIFSEFLQR